MDIRHAPDPRTEGRGESQPIRDYRIAFWHRGAVESFDVIDAADVHEAISWADEEARKRGSTYTLFAMYDYADSRTLVWLAGVDPTVWSRPNFEREHPGTTSLG